MSLVKMSWRNLGRNPRRTMLALTGIAVAQITLVWISSFVNGYQTSIFEKLTGPMLGHVQMHAPKYRDDNAIERTIPLSGNKIGHLRKDPHVASVSPRIYGPVLASVQELGHVAIVTGLDMEVETARLGMLEGLQRKELPAPDEVLIGKSLAEEMRVHQGDSLALMGQAADGSIASGLYRVRRIVRTDVEQINRAGIVMNLKAAQELLAMEDQVHELALRAHLPELIPNLISKLREGPSFSSLEIHDWKELMPQIAAYLEISNTMNLIILILVFLTTTAGIANTMVMATFERRHEFGMLLALGCKPSRLIQILLLEATILGILGVLIGSIFGVSLVTYEMHNGIWLLKMSGAQNLSMAMEGLDISMDIYPILKVSDIARGIIAVVATSVLASLWPARKLSRLEPIEAMQS